MELFGSSCRTIPISAMHRVNSVASNKADALVRLDRCIWHFTQSLSAQTATPVFAILQTLPIDWLRVHSTYHNRIGMIEPVAHPLLFLILAVSVPVYRGLALAIFGNAEGFAAAVKHIKNPDTWKPFNDPWSEARLMDLRWFAFITLCISFVAAMYHFCVRLF